MPSGLLAFDRQKQLVLVLKRVTPYAVNQKWRSRPSHFIEQYHIPRGQQSSPLEPLKTCAIREFIEETNIFMKTFDILPDTFELRWEDPPGVEWTYTIFFMACSLEPKNLLSICENVNIDLIGTAGVNPVKCAFSDRDNSTVVILKFSEYKQIIQKQMQLYHKSNYNKLLEEVDRII